MHSPIFTTSDQTTIAAKTLVNAIPPFQTQKKDGKKDSGELQRVNSQLKQQLQEALQNRDVTQRELNELHEKQRADVLEMKRQKEEIAELKRSVDRLLNPSAHDPAAEKEQVPPTVPQQQIPSSITQNVHARSSPSLPPLNVNS